jgi:hypothetical protein
MAKKGGVPASPTKPCNWKTFDGTGPIESMATSGGCGGTPYEAQPRWNRFE